MIIQKEILLPPFGRGFHLIDDLIENSLGELPNKGLLHIFCKHTSAGLTINENADPAVLSDFESSFNVLVKENEEFYRHTYEGADDMPSHIKASIVGSSVTIPLTNGRLNLGTWQGVYLCEFKNYGGPRKLVITIYS